MTELINNLKNIFTGVTTYQLLEGIVLPTIFFIISGIFVEHKYQITNRITKRLNLKPKQTGESNAQVISSQESGRDSINTASSTSIKGPLIGKQINNYQPSMTPTIAQPEDALKPPESLPGTEYHRSNTDYIIALFEKHSKKLKIASTFNDNLVKVHKDMEAYKNVDASSAEYFNIFKDVIDNLTNKQVFCDREGVDLQIASVKNTFGSLETLMSKQNKRMGELEDLIKTFERNVIALLAYI